MVSKVAIGLLNTFNNEIITILIFRWSIQQLILKFNHCKRYLKTYYSPFSLILIL
jgi:hypothetical protein